MTYVLSKRSCQRLEGVQPELAQLVRHAIKITSVDFTVLESLRTAKRQLHLLYEGATTTLRSRHLTGHAVDLGAYVNGTVSWDWAWYHQIADAMKESSRALNIPVEWGGDWKTFKDGPHFQLPWSYFPVSDAVQEVA